MAKPLDLEVEDPVDEMALSGPCWCGEKNPYYSDSGLEHSCGGTGTLHCFCGGDFCCCHWHGEVECFGCKDCEVEDEDPDYD